MTNTAAAIVYEGPSELDGAPIVVIASAATVNAKTGPVVQTWILRADMLPTDAVKLGLDASICGDCRHRHHTGGACYVNVGQGPWNVWKAYKRGKYLPASATSFYRDIKGMMVRLGSYGDPAAVPVRVWDKLVATGGGWIGYTHQWRRASELRELCMASVDTEAEYAEATAAGWRCFAVVESYGDPPPRAFECVNVTRNTSCSDCGACDGARPDRDVQPASVWLRVHGSMAARFNNQRSRERNVERARGVRPVSLRVL